MITNRFRSLLSVAVALLFIIVLGPTAFADPTNIAPEDVRTAIDEALQDPPMSTDFLIAVWHDASVGKYLEAAPALVVEMEDAQIVFSRHMEAGPIQISMKGVDFSVFLSPETLDLSCEGSGDQAQLCVEIKAYLLATRQSVFWASLKESIRPAPQRS